MQEYLLQEFAFGTSDPPCKRICRSNKKDGIYTCRVSKDTWSVPHWTLNANSRAWKIHILRVRVMLKIS